MVTTTTLFVIGGVMPNEHSNQYVIKDLKEKQPMFNGRMYRMARCWCGCKVSFNGLGGHLHYKHKQKREDCVIE